MPKMSTKGSGRRNPPPKRPKPSDGEYAPKQGTVEWHKFQIQKLLEPFAKTKIKTRNYTLGIPSLRKHRETVKPKVPKAVKTQIKFHKEKIRELRKK